MFAIFNICSEPSAGMANWRLLRKVVEPGLGTGWTIPYPERFTWPLISVSLTKETLKKCFHSIKQHYIECMTAIVIS